MYQMLKKNFLVPLCVLCLLGVMAAQVRYTIINHAILRNVKIDGGAVSSVVRTDVNGIITTSGTGLNQFKTVNGCTVPTTAWATCAVTVSWPTAFPDTNYTVVCSGLGASGGFASKILVNSVDRTSTSVTTVTITDAGNAGDTYAHVACFASE